MQIWSPSRYLPSNLLLHSPVIDHRPQHDDQKVKDYGIKLSVEMIRRLAEEGGMRGFHFCTLNLEKSVRCILEILGWTPGHAEPHARLIAVSVL